jgi:hypothetical protein
MTWRTAPCKRCGSPFRQPLVQGRPWDYCGARCKAAARAAANRELFRERYTAMRAAGVDPKQAHEARTSVARFEELMRRMAG